MARTGAAARARLALDHISGGYRRTTFGADRCVCLPPHLSLLAVPCRPRPRRPRLPSRTSRAAGPRRCRIPRIRQSAKAATRVARLCHRRRLCRLAVPGDRPGAGGREGRLVSAGAVPPRFLATAAAADADDRRQAGRAGAGQGRCAAPSVTDQVATAHRRLRVRRLWPPGRSATASTIIAGSTSAGRSWSRLPGTPAGPAQRYRGPSQGQQGPGRGGRRRDRLCRGAAQ